MPRRPAYQLALAFVLIVAGLGSGYLLNVRSRSNARFEVATLKQEVDDMRRTVAVSLLKQASPSERLMGVSWSSRIDRPGDEIIAALLETLDHDSNVNVRLAAVDALYLFYGHREVKDGSRPFPGRANVTARPARPYRPSCRNPGEAGRGGLGTAYPG